QPRAQQPGQTGAAATGFQLVPSENAIGAEVVNPEGEELGELQDLVVDTNTGRITHGVVSHGGVLGIGGTNVAVPWQGFRWDQQEGRFLVQMTQDRLEQMPEFDRNQLQQLGGGGAAVTGVRGEAQADDDGWSADSQYQSMIQGGQQTQIQGSVTNIT